MILPIFLLIWGECMLKSCGVIVEYNPFHNGHQYHLEKAREKSGADVVVAVMSGNFLQRGEPAIVDKWQRTEAALSAGADLVIELPTAMAVQSADYFASGAVSLLQALSVNALCFGTDSHESLDYEAFAAFNQDNQDAIQKAFLALKSEGLSYPQQMTKVYQGLYPEWPLDEHSPNHILGMSYAKANQGYQHPMALLPIKREGSGYHDERLGKTAFASATAIRQALLRGETDEVASFVTEPMMTALLKEPLIDWEMAWPMLKFQLTQLSISELGKIYQMSEGIEHRIKEKGLQATSFSEFINAVKNKRFTWTRLQRLSVYILLRITEEQVRMVREQPYIRVLGFNSLGQKFLGQVKENCPYPLITNVNQKNSHLLELDIHAGRVYQLFNERVSIQDYQRKPVIKI